MASFRFYLLGAPRLEMDGEPINVDTRKAIALLAYLVINAADGGPTSHTRDAIAALFWPELDQSRARGALRRTLSPLRQAVDKRVLEVSRDSIGVRPGAELWVDVVEFRHLLAATADHAHSPGQECASCRRLLEEAVALYRDDFMAGFTLRDAPEFDEWHYFESEQLRRSLSEALERLTHTYAVDAAYEQAIAFARRHLALDPLSEQAHRNLMQLYAWSGQRSVAVRQYRECVRVLEQELGVAPLAETTALYEQILGDELRSPTRPGVLAPPTEQPQQASTAFAHTNPSTLPLVGREEEWSRLQAAYDATRTGGTFFVVEGEAGVGKTRLAEEFIGQAPGRILRARCFEGETNLTYSPFIEALRQGLEQGPDGWHDAVETHWLAEAARLLPELHALAQQRLGVVRQEQELSQPLDGPGAQSRFYEAVRRVLLALAGTPAPHNGDAPAILFFDDIHWADEASLDLLAYLVKRLDTHPLLLLVTWRPEGLSAGHHLHTVLANARRNSRGARLTLARLTSREVSALVDLFHEAGYSFSDSWRGRLYQESEGLPFFVIEYLQSALERERASDEAQSPPASAEQQPGASVGDVWEIPPGVRGLLQSRLEGVDEIGWQLLNTAAVIGRSFDFDACRLASGRSEEEAVAALERLLARGLIVEEAPVAQRATFVAEQAAARARYDFSHSQIRAFVYQQTSLVRRRLLHRRVAEALLQFGNEDAQAAQIAHHYRQAGQDDQAAAYYARAGKHARALYANSAALAHLRTALALGHPDSAVLHEAIGDLHTLLGAYGEALTHYEAAAARAEARDQARLEHRLGNVYDRRGEWQRAESHFQAALAATRDSAGNEPPDAGLQARILADWSLTAHHQGAAEKALTLANEARDLARRAQDDAALAQGENILGILARNRDELQEARQCLQRSLALATESGLTSARIAALNNLALVYGDGGQDAEAQTTLEDALHLCQKLGDRHREAAILNNLADLHHATGRVDEAMTHLKRAAAIFVEIGSDMAEWTPEIWKLTEW